MDPERFWTAIDAHVIREPTGRVDPRPLARALGGWDAVDVAEFDRWLRTLHCESAHYRLWGAAALVLQDPSDTAFDGFRAWLIAMGRSVYWDAVRDPDSLAASMGPDLVRGECDCEELLLLPTEAYEVLTGGKDLDQPSLELPQLGEPIDFDDRDFMSQAYPRLVQRFGPLPPDSPL